MIRLSILTIILVSVFATVGCAGGGGPTVPASGGSDLAPRSLERQGKRQLWGYWQCALDTELGRIIAVPARTALLHINAVQALNASLGVSFEIYLDDSDPPNGLFVLRVDLTHPFSGNESLAGFDVRGILITTARETAGSFSLPGEDDPVMLVADGYTRWWNPIEFPVPGLLGYTPGILGKDPPPGIPLASMINPYRQFAGALYETSPVKLLTVISPVDLYGRGVFRSGETNSRIYEIQFPVVGGIPQVSYNYAVDASWAPPRKDPPKIPVDFPLEANAPEAFIVEPQVTRNTLWAVEGSNQGGGEIDLEIELWDWQGWMNGYGGQIGALVLISPDCEFVSGVVPDYSVDITGKATLSGTVPGVPSTEGEIPVWVGVTAPMTTYKQTAKPAPDEPVVAFARITVEVASAECEDNGNNDCTTAEPIRGEDSVDGLLCLGVDEEDWFSFTVPPTGSASGAIHLTTFGLTDLNLFLFQNCPGSLVYYSGQIGTMDEEIMFDGLGEGEYYIQVVCAADGDPSRRPYTLETSISGLGEDCTLDDDNRPEDAGEIAIDGTRSDTVCLVGDPVDWYEFEISPDASAYGAIDLHNNDFADNDIALFSDPDDDPLFVGNSPGTVDEHLDITILPEGTYYLKIEAMGMDPQGDRPYTLTVDLIEVVADCDDQDGNNAPEEAEIIGANGTKSGTVCFPSDPDWYTFDLSAGAMEGLITLTSHEIYDNDLALYGDPAMPPIAESSQVGTMDEVIQVADLQEGLYYILATASPDQPGVDQLYELTTELVPVSGSPTDIWLHVHIVRTDQGSNPATDEDTVQKHVAWADEFWGRWARGSFTIHEVTYIDRTAWLSLTTREAENMFEQYGDGSGALHVFYVNDTPDMPGAAAYTWMECQFILQDHETGYVIMTDYADSPVLAHEAGHAIGLLADMYLLDFYTCEQITQCPTGPSDIFCLEADADWGNLMYWPFGSNIELYWVSDTDLDMETPEIDSQAENVMYFHANYPDAFYEP